MEHDRFSRREWLRSSACGFGALALGGLAQAAPHFPPRARRVIFLFMNGGPSPMDTFDYKPLLQRDHGKDLPYPIPELQRRAGRKLKKLLRSPFRFERRGECGHWMSEIFPHLARRADDLCMVKGMHTEGFDHGQAVIRLHTGTDNFVRPAMGSWVVYGLGTENRNLPGFVSILPLNGLTGARGYSNVFLPATTQGTPLGRTGLPVREAKFRNLGNPGVPPSEQRRLLDLVQAQNRDHLARGAADPRVEGMIEAYELAFRMQSEAPRVQDLTGESPATLDLYGIGEKRTDNFGRACLLARRFAEAGVRYVQVTHSYDGGVTQRWDQHGHLEGSLRTNAGQVDKPIAGLLADLKARGLLDDTLVWWGGEFGRTPVAEHRTKVVGRDHNPHGFTMWLAGGGVKPGFSFGATDDYGYHAVEDKVHMHDLHATILHLLGLNHEKLTHRYAGRDFRLTDVYGRVVKEIIA